MLATVCGVVLALATSAAPEESTLTLPALESAVLRLSPALTEARANADAAHARIAAAGAPEDPMVDAMLAPASIGSSEVPTGYRVEVTQSLSFLGRSGAARARATAEAEESAADARTTVLDVLRQARMAFADYAVAYRTLAYTREMRHAVDRMHDAALARYAAASTGASDALRAEAELAMLDHEIDNADAERQAAAAAMNALVHRAVDSPVPPPGALLLDETMHAHGPHALRRPEVDAADARIARERAALSLASREGVPVPSVGVAFDHYWSEKPLQTSLLFSISLPLFGRAGAMRREAEAALAGAEAGRSALRDRIDAEVAQAGARVDAAEHGVETMRDRVVPARERALRAAQSEYTSGALDMTSALSAARDLLQGRIDLVQSEAAALRAHADLWRATGVDPALARGEVQP